MESVRNVRQSSRPECQGRSAGSKEAFVKLLRVSIGEKKWLRLFAGA